MYTIPKFNSALEPLVCLSEAFTPQDIQNIIDMGDKQIFMDGRVGSAISEGAVNENVRNSKITWIEPHSQNEWLFQRMCEVASRINYDKYQFELDGLPSFQYTTYEDGQFYDWHIDADNQFTYGPRHRKLSFSLLLSDPETEFEGGEFQFVPGGNIKDIEIAKMKKGDIVAFPSFIPHRVTPVTSGKRRSLVFWVLGPKFK